MHLELLVEEPSAAAALQNLVPRMIGKNVTYRLINFQGKQDLLAQLPQRLRGYTHWLPPDWRIVVLIDEDREDCLALKGQLETAARQAGLFTKSSPAPDGHFEVVSRLAIEELEAWFLGDVEAIRQVYPQVPETLASRRPFRNPDAIAGGTFEALERVLQQAGYFKEGLPKIQTAREISQHMDPDRNRSKSFQVFRDCLRGLAYDPSQ
jgi:hypothetical protein